MSVKQPDIRRKRLSYRKMFKWCESYPIISGIKGVEFPSIDDVMVCFARLMNSRNTRYILDVNYKNLYKDGKYYYYDESPKEL